MYSHTYNNFLKYASISSSEGQTAANPPASAQGSEDVLTTAPGFVTSVGIDIEKRK